MNCMRVLSLGTMLLAVMLCTGCNEEKMAIWTGTSQETDLCARAGIVSGKGTTEVGVEVEYDRTSDVEWGPTPDRVGPYVIFWLTQDMTITDTPESSPLKDVLESLHARPYVGMNLLGGVDDGWRNIQPNFKVGTMFTSGDGDDIGVYVEYKDGDSVAPGMYVGVVGRF